MYSFNNDYSEGSHPQILENLIHENLIQNTGYGLDCHCEHASALIKEAIACPNADVHFLVGGTQTNQLVIATALRPHQAVICAYTGHINVHETGAIEATGHKVLGQPTADGKLTVSQIQATLDYHTDEHMVQPKMVYISNTTEVGTQYNKEELTAISHFCRQNNLYLFLDGARLGSALTSPANDLTLADLAELTDVFYIGGTKNGALFGEALVIVHDALKPDFRFMIKQHGAMLAKGWLLGVQFETLFQNNLFFDLASHANEMAAILKKAFVSAGFSFQWDSSTNQLFPILPNSVIDTLSKDFIFSNNGAVDENYTCVRFVTSWATRPDGVAALVKALESLS